MAVAAATPSYAAVVAGVSSSDELQSVSFSSGNPRIEETRGVVLLHPDVSSPSDLPAGRSTLVFVTAVPNHMTYADFCRFCGAFVSRMLEMRIVRIDKVDDQYSVIIRFDDYKSTDDFYKHFNGRQFMSFEETVSRIRYVVDVQYMGSIEHAQSLAASSTEPSTCPVCLERLDQDPGGILTTICNHSFHCSCISKWTDSSCPVCRYCQQLPERSTCAICGTSENLWICVICGFVGCGRYKGGHAIEHWKETQHCYSLDVETQRVWDYVGDNYVHRLIQSKTDGKLVELNPPSSQAEGTCQCAEDSCFDEALYNSKVEAILQEYNDLLTSQLEGQRKQFESQLQEVREENEKQVSDAVEKAMKKLQKTEAKLTKCMEDKKFLEEINEHLVKNQEAWKAKIQQAEEREAIAVRLKDEKIQRLEEQLRDLIAHIECRDAVGETSGSVSDDIKGGTIVVGPPASPPGDSIPQGSRVKRNRKRGQ